MTNRDQHILEDTLNSLRGIKRAEASPFLYGRIMERMKEQLPAPAYYSGKIVIQFALAMLLIASLNIFSVSILRTKGNTQPINEEAALHGLAQEYFGFDNINTYAY